MPALLVHNVFQVEDTVWLILGILINFFIATLAVTVCQIRTGNHESQFLSQASNLPPSAQAPTHRVRDFYRISQEE
jgi:hypothetical protein